MNDKGRPIDDKGQDEASQESRQSLQVKSSRSSKPLLTTACGFDELKMITESFEERRETCSQDFSRDSVGFVPGGASGGGGSSGGLNSYNACLSFVLAGAPNPTLISFKTAGLVCCASTRAALLALRSARMGPCPAVRHVCSCNPAAARDGRHAGGRGGTSVRCRSRHFGPRAATARLPV